MLRSEVNRQASVRLQPEAGLLLSCAGADVSEMHAARFQALLHEKLDWDEVMQIAMQHGVLPLLYWHLDHVDSTFVPAAACEQLSSYFYANKLHNNRLTDKLLNLLHQFSTHGITAVPFKGPALAVAAYGNLDLRQFGDLDILVPERDCRAAMCVLLSQGFRLKSSALNMEEEMAQLSRCAYSFFHDADGISVDLHWGITAAMEYPDRAFALPLDAIDVWERLESLSLAGTQVLHFAPEDLLLMLCIHGSKHCWERLGWLCDIAQLIHACPEMPWARIRSRASHLGCRRMLELGVLLAHTVCGVRLPKPVLRQVRLEAVVRSLAKGVERDWFAGVESETSILTRSRFYLRMRERWQDKVQYSVWLAKWLVNHRLRKHIRLAEG